MAIGWDETSPADNGSIPAFPANERAFRAAVKAGYAYEHDSANGRHKFGYGNSTARDAITTWVDGSIWFLLSGGVYKLQQRIGGAWEDILPPSQYADRDAVAGWTGYQYISTVTVNPTAGSPNLLAVVASLASHRKSTLTADTKLSNPSTYGSNRMTVVTMEIYQDGSGGHALTFDTNYVFPGKVVPLISTAANSRSFLTLTRLDDGKWLVTMASDVGV